MNKRSAIPFNGAADLGFGTVYNIGWIDVEYK